MHREYPTEEVKPIMRNGTWIPGMIVVFALAVVPVRADLLTNGDFETGDLTGWTFWRAGWGSGENVQVQAAEVGSGNYALNEWFVGGGSGSFGVYQEVPVTPGTPYRVTGQWKGEVSTGFNWFEVILIDGPFDLDAADNPDQVWDNMVSAYHENAPTIFDWEPISNTYTNGPYIVDGVRTATSDTMTVVLKLGGFGEPTAWFDDVRMTAVPEPTALFLLAGGALVSAARRRRR